MVLNTVVLDRHISTALVVIPVAPVLGIVLVSRPRCHVLFSLFRVASVKFKLLLVAPSEKC